MIRDGAGREKPGRWGRGEHSKFGIVLRYRGEQSGGGESRGLSAAARRGHVREGAEDDVISCTGDRRSGAVGTHLQLKARTRNL